MRDKKNHFAMVFSALLTALVFAAASQAAVLASESFDYTPGTALNSQGTTGAGWAGAWSGNSQFVVESNAYDANYPDMSYPTVPTSGARLGNSPVGSWYDITRNLDVTGSFANYEETNGNGQSVIGKDGTSLWVGYLWQGPSHDQGVWLGLADDYINNWSAKINFGANKGVDWDHLSLFERTPAHTYVAATTTVQGNNETHLLVARVDFGAGNDDTIRMYIDPDLSADPSTWVDDANMTGFDMSFYRILLGRADTTNKYYGWDEIRIGETAADVVGAVPEPATMCLLAIGGIAVLRRRRRHA